MADVLFDSGASGDTITPGNSNVTSVGGNTSGNTATLSPDAAWHGGLGGLFKTVAGGNVAGCFFTRIYDEGDDDQQTLSGVVLLPLAAPSSDFTMGSWRDPSNGTIMRFFYRQSDGGLYIADQGATYTLVAAASAFSWNTRYRLTVTADVGTTTTNGVFTAKLRKASDQTQVGVTATSSSANLGTAAFHRFVGGIVGNNLGYQVGWDDVQLYSNRVDELPNWAPPANIPPVVNAGDDQTLAIGTSLTRTATATDADGTIASQQWTCTSKPAALSATPTFAAGATFSYGFPQPGTYVFAFTATDDDGASATDTVTITAVSNAAPTAVVSQTTGPGLIDARASSSAAGGSLSFSISPAGPAQLAPGLWYQAPTSVAQTYTVTVTESGSGQTASASTTIAPVTTVAPYDGGPLVLDLPTPGDVTDADKWADLLNTEIDKIVTKLLSIQSYLKTPAA